MAPSPPRRDDCITLEMSAVLQQGSSHHCWETFLFMCSYLWGQRSMSSVFLSHCPHLIFHSIIIIIIITRERAHKNVCGNQTASGVRGQLSPSISMWVLPLYNQLPAGLFHSRFPSSGLNLEPVLWLSGG